MSAIEAYLARPWLAHYQKGVPDRVEVPLKSVHQAFDEAAARAPGNAAVVFYGRSITYGELREASDRLACALAALGVKKGDRVALYLLNSPQYIIAYFAVLKCGAIVTPISPVYTSHEVRHQLADSGASAIVCQDILYDNVAKSGAAPALAVISAVSEYLPALRRLFSRKAEVPEGVHRLQELLRKYPPRPPGVDIDPRTDLAALPYTGGTTGNPKGVMLTHHNLIAAQTMQHDAELRVGQRPQREHHHQHRDHGHVIVARGARHQAAQPRHAELPAREVRKREQDAERNERKRQGR